MSNSTITPITIDIGRVIASKNESLAKCMPNFIISLLKRLIHQDELNIFFAKAAGLTGADFAQAALDELNVRCNIKYIDRNALNGDSLYIFVSNHPLGGLDGLALICELGKKMREIRFVVNDFLMNIKPLEPIFVPVNKVGRMGTDYLGKFEEAYNSSAQILYFPAGLCSRLIGGEITDTEWKTSFIKQAVKYNREIVPIYFSGQNSKFFYRLAKLRKFLKIKFNIEMCFLPDEMFKQKNATFDVVIGTPVKVTAYKNNDELKQICSHIREKCYSLKDMCDK